MLCSLAPEIFSTKIVNASNAEEIYVPHAAPETVTEAARSTTVTQDISNYFPGYPFYDYRQYFQSSSVTRSVMGSQASGLGYYYDFVTVFYKGHNVPWGCGSHYRLLDYTAIGGVEDDYMFYNTLAGKHDFVFLWACATTLSYWGPSGTYYCSICNAYRGPCYCWQHNNQMSTDGYINPSTAYPEVFLGFNWTSADFSRHDANMISGKDYGSFADAFYQQLLQNGNSVHGALDVAARAVFIGCTSFSDCPLRSGILGDQGQASALQVYGNGNSGLP